MKETIKILVFLWIAVAMTVIAVVLFRIEASLNFPEHTLKNLGIEHPIDYLKYLENIKPTP